MSKKLLLFSFLVLSPLLFLLPPSQTVQAGAGGYTCDCNFNDVK